MKPADIRRQFWARFLGSSVKDGQVPGFSRWHAMASATAVRLAETYAEACVRKIERGRELEECLEAGVSALRHAIRDSVPYHEPSPEMAYQAAELVGQVGMSLEDPWAESSRAPA